MPTMCFFESFFWEISSKLKNIKGCSIFLTILNIFEIKNLVWLVDLKNYFPKNEIK